MNGSAEYNDEQKLERRLDAIYQLISQKQFEYAEKQLREILSAQPEYHRALELLHNVFHKTDCDQESLELAQHSIQLGPDRSEGYFMLSQSQTSLGQYKAALEAILESTRIEPYNDYYLLQLSCCYYNKGSYPESLEAALRCASYESDYAYCYYMIGQCYEALKQPKLAEEAYYQAIEIDPQLSVAHHALSVRERKTLFKATTMNHAESALRLNPTNKEYEGEFRKSITHRHKLWKLSIWFTSGESFWALALEFSWFLFWLIVMIFTGPINDLDPQEAFTTKVWLLISYAAFMLPYVFKENGILLLSKHERYRPAFKTLDRRMAWLNLAPVLLCVVLQSLSLFVDSPWISVWLCMWISFCIMKISVFSYAPLNYGLYAFMTLTMGCLLTIESIMFLTDYQWEEIWAPFTIGTTLCTMLCFGFGGFFFLLCHADAGDRFDKEDR